MFIRTSLSIVFLKCSASSVPVGHGGTNCPSGRFDLPVGLAVVVSLGSPVRRHAAYVCVGVLTQQLSSGVRAATFSFSLPL